MTDEKGAASPAGSMWWNIFSSKACMLLRALGSVMVLVVLGMIGLTYYTTVVLVYGPLVGENTPDGKFATWVLVIYHILIFMTLWCYFAVLLTEPGRVPDGWQPPPDDDDEDVEAADAVEDKKSNSEKRRRFCRKCTQWKPERTHHCSVCGRCVLKMDHHCVWVNNCVGAHNYKFFLLFLLYTFLATVFDAVVLLSNFVDFFKDMEAAKQRAPNGGDPSAPSPPPPGGSPTSLSEQQNQGAGMACVFGTFVLDIAFAASLLGFIIMHANLVLSNMTTIEMYEKKKMLPWRFDRGRSNNLQEIFGISPWTWLLPVHTDNQLFRLLHISRVSGGRYPEMALDGLDPEGEWSEAGDEPAQLPKETRSTCCP